MVAKYRRITKLTKVGEVMTNVWNGVGGIITFGNGERVGINVC